MFRVIKGEKAPRGRKATMQRAVQAVVVVQASAFYMTTTLRRVWNFGNLEKHGLVAESE